jgi:CBS domain-containing protein
MKCADVMKKDVRCLAPTDTVRTAAELMRTANIGFVPVCEKDGSVVGAITDRDIVLRVVANGRTGDDLLDSAMTREVVACHAHDEIERAEHLMALKHKSRILCTDERGRIAGVISLSDIAVRLGGAHAAKTLREVSSREAPMSR